MSERDASPLNAPANLQSAICNLQSLTVMDPCVGSGHFLREAFDLLAAMYREQHPDWDAQRIVETILRRHLHGVDIDPRAVQLSALTLYMRALELLRDEARARRRPMPRWTPPQINLATTPSGLDAAALERHLARHPEDRPLRPVLERIFETLSQAEILGSLLRPGAEIDSAIAEALKPQQANMFELTTDSTDNTDNEESNKNIRAIRAIRGEDTAELKRLVLDRIAAAFRAEAGSADPADALFGREAERGVRLLQLLDRRYAVVVTNPPYMGSKNMPDVLKKYVERNYKPGKRDLYAAFILRCLNLCVQGGRVAMVTQQSWMLLQSFSELRASTDNGSSAEHQGFRGLLLETSLETLAHLGPRAFEDISGEVVQTVLTVIKNKSPHSDSTLLAIRATAALSVATKKIALRQCRSDHPSIFITPQLDFTRLPESPIVYWLPEQFMHLFQYGKRFATRLKTKQGAVTGDNNRFLRYFWEAGNLDAYDVYLKGLGYQRWYGFTELCIRWNHNKPQIASFSVGRVKSPEDFVGQGWAYSSMAQSKMSPREYISGWKYDNRGPVVFPQDQDYYTVGAVLASHLGTQLLRYIAQGNDFNSYHVDSLPLWTKGSSFPFAVTVKWLVSAAKYIASTEITDRLFEPRIESQRLSQLIPFSLFLEAVQELAVLNAYEVSEENIAVILADTGTPAGFHPLIAGYDALPELPAELELPELPREVVEYLERHERISPSPTELARIKARLRALYEAGPGAKDDGADDNGNAEGDEDDEGEDDEGEGAVAGAHIPIPTETFLEELSVKMELHPITVYWLLEELRAEGARCKPEERRLLEDRLSVLALRLLGHRWPRQIEAGEPLPAWADADGIIPLVNLGTGETTLAERLRARLREEDGNTGAQRTEAVLTELTGATSLEDWLARIFWPRHVRQFKSRPIAWHLASRPVASTTKDTKAKSRGGRREPLFECMLYYHATGGDALARLRTQYVEPLLRREESALNEALGKDNAEAAEIANNRVQELREFLARIQQVEREGFACAELNALLAREPLDRWSGDGIAPPASRDDLLRQERAWHVDLNDGVRVNIAPLQLAGLLPGEVLRAADAKKAIADRARWRADERRWVREGKLPRCGWLPESVPESPEWTRKAPERAAEKARLEEKRRAAQASVILEE